jgi:hypothetical protein
LDSYYKIDPRVVIGDGRLWPKQFEDALVTTIFISHTKDDKPLVEEILDYCSHYLALELPHEIWYDSGSIAIGESITKQVQKGINDSSLVILCASRKSLKSGWVEKEWTTKISTEIADRMVGVVCILLDEIGSQELPAFLRDKLFLRVPSDRNGSDYVMTMNKLIRDVKDALTRQTKMARPQVVTLPVE